MTGRERPEARTVEERAGRASPGVGDLVVQIAAHLGERGARVALAESCTGGGVMRALTDLPGSSGWFVGGVVAYADPVKRSLLGVPDRLLRAEGAVSEGVAVAMAEGVRTRLGAEYGVAVTGVAGPGGGSPEKPVGTVWLAIARSGGTRTLRVRLPGDRAEVRARTIREALALLLQELQGTAEATEQGPTTPTRT